MKRIAFLLVAVAAVVGVHALEFPEPTKCLRRRSRERHLHNAHHTGFDWRLRMTPHFLSVQSAFRVALLLRQQRIHRPSKHDLPQRLLGLLSDSHPSKVEPHLTASRD